MAKGNETVVSLFAIKSDETNTRRKHARERVNRVIRLGTQPIYGIVQDGVRMIGFHKVEGMNIVSSRGDMDAHRHQKDSSWGLIFLRPDEVVTFVLPSREMVSKNQIHTVVVA